VISGGQSDSSLNDFIKKNQVGKWILNNIFLNLSPLTTFPFANIFSYGSLGEILSLSLFESIAYPAV
jgi:hypothetical protein